MTLFEPDEPAPQAEVVDPTAPLAARMRPRSLDEVVGQDHLLEAGSPLRRLVEGDAPMSLILYGPPGTGKTTLALLVASANNRRFAQLSALNAGVKEVRAVIEEARKTHEKLVIRCATRAESQALAASLISDGWLDPEELGEGRLIDLRWFGTASPALHTGSGKEPISTDAMEMSR